MRVQIVARHCDVPDSVRQRTQEQIDKLARYDPRVSGADVVFDEEKHTRKVEVVLSVDRTEPVRAHAEGEEFRTALDKVIDRLSRRLKRRRASEISHQGPSLAEGMAG